MQRRLKILISAYACSPYRGSEPGMGWNFVYVISKYHEVHVITEEFKWKKDIDQKLDEEPTLRNNLKFYYIYKKRNKPLRKIWPPSYYWYYRQWQRKAYQLALTLDGKENFDIVHQLNMVGFREPGYLWKIDKPFVWGPIGGMGITPWRMLPSMGFYGFTYYFGRNLINLWQMHFKTRPQKAATRQKSALIAATGENGAYIRKLWKREAPVISEVGLLTDSYSRSLSKRIGVLNICWSGQFTPGKSLNLLLDSLNLAGIKDNFHLHILGDGTRREAWQKKATRLGLSELITWHGWVERSTAIEIMKSCHLFVITSLSDLTSTVLLEALSSGLPVLAPDHCGFSDVITSNCGIKIPLDSKKQFITDLAKNIELLYSDEKERQSLSEGAVVRAQDFSWDKKVIVLNNIYQSLLG